MPLFTSKFRRAGVALSTIAFAILAIFASANVHAQTQPRPGAAPAVKPTMVAVSVSFFSLDNDLLNVKYDTGGKQVPIRVIPKNYRTEAYEYVGPDVLEFYRETKDAEDKPARTIVATAKIPATSGNFLLLFKSIGNDRSGVMVIPDPLTANSPNTWRIVNLSARPIGFESRPDKSDIKEFVHNVVIHSGQSLVLNYGTKEGYSVVRTFVPNPKNKAEWAIAHDTRRPHKPGVPPLLIYFDEPSDPTRLSVRRIPSVIRSAPSSEKSATGTRGGTTRGGSSTGTGGGTSAPRRR